jgi:hypothetical protein
VYSENQLRNVVGNIQRGKRVVIVGTIPISKPVEIKIAEDLTTTIVSQFVTITGFGSGRLERKQGVDDPFNMFLIRTESLDNPSGLHFLDLSFDGFDAAIATKTNTVCNLRVIGCTVERCRTLIGDASTGNGFLLEATIQNNWCYGSIDRVYCALTSGVEYQSSRILNNTMTIPSGSSGFFSTDPVMDDKYFDCIISGNNFGEGSLVTILIRKSLFSSNNSEGNFELRGFGVAGVDQNVINSNYNGSGTGMAIFNMSFSTISGNTLTVLNVDLGGPATSEWLNITGNTFSFEPVLNVECFIFRNNFGGTTFWESYGDGRIPIDGEILGQTIIDTTDTTPVNPFICVNDQVEPANKILASDNNASDKADVTFNVPCGEVVTVRLHCHLYDDNKAVDDITYIRIVEVSGGIESLIPAVNCNDIQQIIVSEGGSGPKTFEWLVRGNINAHWVAGEEVTIRFKISADHNAANVWVMAGSHGATANDKYGPLLSAIESPYRKTEFITPT